MPKTRLVTRFLSVSVVTGVFLINAPIGLAWSFGNLSTYLLSFFKFHAGPNALDLSAEWLLATYIAMVAVGVFSVDFVTRIINIHAFQVLAVVIFNLGIFLTYFTVQRSASLLLVTLMVCGGYGCGVINMLGLIYTSKVVSRRVGLISATVTSAIGIGTTIDNYIAMFYINPDNLTPNIREKTMVYFSQPVVLDKVPGVFTAIGLATLCFHVVGLVLQQFPIHCFQSMAAMFVIPKSTNGTTPEKTSDPTDYQTNHQGNGDVCRSKAETVTDYTGVDSSINECARLKNKDSLDLKPSQVIKTRSFYLMSLSVIVMTYANFLVINYFKLYGQLWIKDDAFLTSVGSFSALIVVLYRILAGFSLDKFGVKNTLVSGMAILAIVINMWYFSPQWNRWLYFVCCQIVTGLSGSIYILFPISALKLYGPKFYATNYGLVLVPNVIMNLASPFVFPFIIESNGWFGIVLWGSAVSTFAVVCLVFFMPEDKCNKSALQS